MAQNGDPRLKSQSDSLIEVGADGFGTLLPFLPDTPWTTGVVHGLQSRRAKAFVDSQRSPRNAVVVTPGDGTAWRPHLAFLFGAPGAEAIRAFVEGAKGPIQFQCDEEMAALVRGLRSETKARETVVYWYADLEPPETPPTDFPVRRLRLTDAPRLQDLLPSWAQCSYTDAKDLLMSGGAYGVFEGEKLVCAAFTVESSVKYDRIGVCTVAAARRKGYAIAAIRKLIRSCTDQSRLPCAQVPRENIPGLCLAERLGFADRATMRGLLVT